MNRLDIKEFIKRADKIHNGEYDYSKVVYTGMDNKVIIICKKHGEFYQTPHNHLKYGCSKCGKDKQVNSRTHTDKIFIDRANNKFNNKYDYSLVEYVNANTKVKIVCPTHGVFEQTPYLHLISKYGCPECSDKLFDKTSKSYKSRNNLKLEDFIEDAIKTHNGKYDYSLIDKDNWVGLKSKINIVCPIHGVFTQKAKLHREGCGCRKCFQSKGELEISKYLDKTGVRYTEQFTFKDCKYKGLLPFDFAIFNEDGSLRCLIEYQGIQHFKEINFGSSTFGEFETQEIRDNIKKEYCDKNNIQLLEVTCEQDLDMFFEEAGGLLWK